MEIQRGEFERTTTHWWWRPGWGPETRYLTFHLTFTEEPALAATAERYSGVLNSLANLDPVPVPWLHLTMTGVGHAAEVSDEIVDALCERVLADAARRIDGQPPIVFDTLYFGRDGLSLTGQAPDWLILLRQRQEQAVEDLLGGPRAWHRARPHVTLAYYDGEVDESALLDGVKAAGLDGVVLTRPTLSLLELRRDGHLYRWRTVGECPLELGDGR
ncbi:MAG: hypothetical protein QM708_05365 [Propioniciclava sp.]|uniref:hypothetical protein n=1 Tax=Propioniciclava sp. TaxID=2038686 RepID=UPI0039E24731